MKFLSIISSLLLFTVVTSAQGADIEKGKAKAAVCAGCHGKTGISLVPIYPNLKGQNAGYTVKQLQAFKNKTRKDPMMMSMAAGLSDEDMANIAAFYESLGTD